MYRKPVPARPWTRRAAAAASSFNGELRFFVLFEEMSGAGVSCV